MSSNQTPPEVFTSALSSEIHSLDRLVEQLNEIRHRVVSLLLATDSNAGEWHNPDRPPHPAGHIGHLASANANLSLEIDTLNQVVSLLEGQIS